MNEVINSERDTKEAADAIITSVTHCIDRGPDRGKCHVFLDHSNICQCEDIDLEHERMK